MLKCACARKRAYVCVCVCATYVRLVLIIYLYVTCLQDLFYAESIKFVKHLFATNYSSAHLYTFHSS